MQSLVHVSSAIAQLTQSGPIQISVNPDDGRVYGALIDPDTEAVSNQPKLLATLLPEAILEGNDLHSESELTIVGLKPLPKSSQICLITSDGRISVCPMEEIGQEEEFCPFQFDTIGTFDDGICFGSWSPDDELLVIVTGSSKLVLLIKTFDVLSEAPIDFARLGDDQPVNLGWGTKSTQFHGSLGKSAAQVSEAKTLPFATIPPKLFSLNAYKLSWRDDEQAHASSETIINCTLRSKIAWRPEGSIIASVLHNTSRDKLNVIFFERNGLQRYGFDLHEADRIHDISGLSWNSDSSILAVGVKKLGSTHSSDNVKYIYAVQLWARSNYHWYLKHEARADLHQPLGSEAVPSMMWHPEIPLCLYFTASGTPTSFDTN
ncbi:hypothetical protein O181_012021 [Austropuccinia psidii MF-1]|uniref:ELP1 first N-terminal beta-propeller domain-containing protein n=1 Tax=Austropuccinia psidii MF-1 TaxID=1389203 RepID=A0A9Q3BTV4_9BASI|nr:hypothetical protein [Austropuccinia psidii MF-1]